MCDGARRIVAGINCALELNYLARRKRICDLHVNVVPDHHLEHRAQIFNRNDRKGFAFLAREFFFHLNDDAGGFEQRAVVELFERSNRLIVFASEKLRVGVEWMAAHVEAEQFLLVKKFFVFAPGQDGALPHRCHGRCRLIEQ